MAQIRLQNLSKRFDGTVPALQDVCLSVEAGELLVVVGPSGSGKTTLLRIIAGLETPDSGRLYFDEKDMTDVDPKQRNVAMVFQEGNLYPHLFVRDNMAFPLKARRLPASQISKTVRKAAQMLHIEDLLDRRPHTLSAGQRGRVALGRAMVRQPAVFLLDEPLANLDVELRHRMRTEIRSLQRSLGATMVYVTHDQNEAMSLADRICLLRDGAVQQTGSPMEMYRHPANRFVAGFFGYPSMNFIPGRIREEGGEALFICPLGAIGLPALLAETAKKNVDCDIVLGIRPEHIAVVKKSSPQDFCGNIRSLEMLGRETLVTVETTEEIRMTFLSDPDIFLSIDQSVQLHIDADKMLLFEACSEGRRLTPESMK
ncbi:MAG: ABC transporter ATP-binding protein [Sedimentisphaerales bacterium]|nr:ABC transporter ATP-binding protein [Sedimentisphaerales bacterium]